MLKSGGMYMKVEIELSPEEAVLFVQYCDRHNISLEQAFTQALVSQAPEKEIQPAFSASHPALDPCCKCRKDG